LRRAPVHGRHPLTLAMRVKQEEMKGTAGKPERGAFRAGGVVGGGHQVDAAEHKLAPIVPASLAPPVPSRRDHASLLSAFYRRGHRAAAAATPDEGGR